MCIWFTGKFKVIAYVSKYRRFVISLYICMSLVSVANLLLSQAYVVRVTVPDLVNATATFVLNPHNGHSVISSHQLTSVLAPLPARVLALVYATAPFSVNHHIRKSPGAGPGMPQLHLLAISVMAELSTMVTA